MYYEMFYHNLKLNQFEGKKTSLIFFVEKIICELLKEMCD